MKLFLLSIALLLVLSFPAAAQRNYEVPEYSGSTPRMDNSLERLQTQNELIRRSVQQRREAMKLRSNDIGVDTRVHERGHQILKEMDLRREEMNRTNNNHYNQ